MRIDSSRVAGTCAHNKWTLDSSPFRRKRAAGSLARLLCRPTHGRGRNAQAELKSRFAFLFQRFHVQARGLDTRLLDK